MAAKTIGSVKLRDELENARMALTTAEKRVTRALLGLARSKAGSKAAQFAAMPPFIRAAVNDLARADARETKAFEALDHDIATRALKAPAQRSRS